MGALISAVWQRLTLLDSRIKIVVVGLGNSGKTTILYQLNLGTVVKTQPTIGSNVEEVTHRNMKVQVWDVGGQESLRSSWSAYFQNTDALIFVVDSNDIPNLTLVKMELYNALLNDDLKEAVLLVFANKQDITGARSVGELSCELGLPFTLRSHEWNIQPCCAISGKGLKEGMDWIVERILAKREVNLF